MFHSPSTASQTTERLSIFKQRDLVQRARMLLENPQEALTLLEQLAGVTDDASAAVSNRALRANSSSVLPSIDGSPLRGSSPAAAANGLEAAVVAEGRLSTSSAEVTRLSPTMNTNNGTANNTKQNSIDFSAVVTPLTPLSEQRKVRPPSTSMTKLSQAVGVIDDPAVVAEALFLRGLCLGNLHRNEDAYTTAEDILTRFPTRSEGYYLKGLSLFALDFPIQEAQAAIDKGLALDVSNKGDERVAEIKKIIETSLQAQRLLRFKLGLVKHMTKYNCYETPHCSRCDTMFVNPTLGWFCPHCMRDEMKTGRRELSRVWQPDDEGAAQGCACCKKALGGTFSAFISSKSLHHCRCCGRVVCGGCSSKKSTVDVLLVREPERVCNKCYDVLAKSTHIRSTSPLPLRALTEDELGVHLGCAPAPSVGRVGVDLNGMVADYASPVVRTNLTSSFCEVDHIGTNTSGAAQNDESSSSNHEGGNSSFAGPSSSTATSRTASISANRSSCSAGRYSRSSNVHTCVKSSFEQQLWLTGNNKTKKSFFDASNANLTSTSAEDAQEEAEVRLAKFLLPFQDVYAED